ncbi:hypothetical protein PUN28_000846 [Cardiocondyla obscurior]|uniref:Uncharacterized protein n=1 Tax=Cardiocondyla obscurior TaxID=286306 RepID=A0AAW2H1T4_9HYME
MNRAKRERDGNSYTKRLRLTGFLVYLCIPVSVRQLHFHVLWLTTRNFANYVNPFTNSRSGAFLAPWPRELAASGFKAEIREELDFIFISSIVLYFLILFLYLSIVSEFLDQDRVH